MLRTSDPVVLTLVRVVKDEIQRQTEALTIASFSSLYDVGRIQGKLDGLKQSLQLLDDILMDQEERE